LKFPHFLGGEYNHYCGSEKITRLNQFFQSQNVSTKTGFLVCHKSFPNPAPQEDHLPILFLSANGNIHLASAKLSAAKMYIGPCFISLPSLNPLDASVSGKKQVKMLQIKVFP
jgi:hypothetical protein